LIYHKAKAGELDEESGLSALAKLTEVDIKEVGVDGAKNFFEAKVDRIRNLIQKNKRWGLIAFWFFQIEQLKAQSKFEQEVRKEQEEKRRFEAEKKQKRQDFAKKHALFEQITL